MNSQTKNSKRGSSILMLIVAITFCCLTFNIWGQSIQGRNNAFNEIAADLENAR